MTDSRKTLNDAYDFDNTLTGIFKDLQKLNVPWKDKNIENSLDLAFYGMYAGEKKLLNLFNKWATDDEGGKLSDEHKTTIAKICYDIYGDRWQKLWDTLNFEYDPIANYDMTEHREYSDNDTETRDLADGSTATTATDVYAYNSTTETPNDKATIENSGTQSGTITGEKSGSHDITRKGNIGVTTSQQMIQSERELWIYKYFEDTVFPDIAKTLTLAIY